MKTILLFLFIMAFSCEMARPRAAGGVTSYIDDHNRFILNGEPFFPLGLYFYWKTQPFPTGTELDAVSKSPFDTLMHYSTAGASDPEITEFLDQLQSRGLKLIFSLYSKGCNDQNTECLLSSDVINSMTEKVTAFKADPAIIAWYMNDEICPECLLELENAYERIKDLDDNHPVWSVHWNTDWLVQEAHTTDIVGVDPYPIGTANPITLVSEMADAANEVGKPLWLVPQLFSWTNDPSGAPTREEMRAMTYLAVNHGAKGLIYYSYSDIVGYLDYDTRWGQIKEIAAEIDQLRSVFLSTYQTNETDVTCDNSDIDFKLMREGNTYYLFAVNTTKDNITGASFQINLSVKPDKAEVLFEDDRQDAPVVDEDGNFTDDFDPYEVHVYQWSATTATDGGGSSGGSCFIATAAFGSAMEKHVTILKDFRNTCLLPYALGRSFVKVYYKYSPPLAHFIEEHEVLKVAIRMSLLPLVAMSYAILQFGPVITFSMLIALFMLPSFLFLSYRRIASRSIVFDIDRPRTHASRL